MVVSESKNKLFSNYPQDKIESAAKGLGIERGGLVEGFEEWMNKLSTQQVERLILALGDGDRQSTSWGELNLRDDSPLGKAESPTTPEGKDIGAEREEQYRLMRQFYERAKQAILDFSKEFGQRVFNDENQGPLEVGLNVCNIRDTFRARGTQDPNSESIAQAEIDNILKDYVKKGILLTRAELRRDDVTLRVELREGNFFLIVIKGSISNDIT